MLINAVKDVASALRDLIGATKNAAGKSPSDPTVKTLKESAKVRTFSFNIYALCLFSVLISMHCVFFQF